MRVHICNHGQGPQSIESDDLGQEPDTLIFTCEHVVEHGAPILAISHSEDDGSWQFLCDADHSAPNTRCFPICYEHILDLDPGLATPALQRMPRGSYAERKSGWHTWEFTS